MLRLLQRRACFGMTTCHGFVVSVVTRTFRMCPCILAFNDDLDFRFDVVPMDDRTMFAALVADASAFDRVLQDHHAELLSTAVTGEQREPRLHASGSLRTNPVGVVTPSQHWTLL